RALRRLSHEPPGRDGDPQELLTRRLEALADTGALVIEDGVRVYLPPLYEAETDLADHLRRLLDGPGAPAPAAAGAPGQLPGPEAPGLLDAHQAQAVRTALSRPLTVITGGPGTGKTLTIRALLAAAAALPGGCRAVLAAPTGRAARRLAEVTGQPAARPGSGGTRTTRWRATSWSSTRRRCWTYSWGRPCSGRSPTGCGSCWWATPTSSRRWAPGGCWAT